MSLFTQGLKADQATTRQAQGTALLLGRNSSFHDGPAMASLPFQLLFARGRDYYAPVVQTPCLRNCLALFTIAQGVIPSWGMFPGG